MPKMKYHNGTTWVALDAANADTLGGLAASALPVSTATQTALNLKANLASPTFTGTPLSTTAAVGTNTTQIATTAFVNSEIANDAAPIAHVGGTGAAHGAATTSVNGFMSSTDKTKLDGVATGAEVNQNAFSNIAVSGQTTVAADGKTDTLTLVAGTNIGITTNATTDTITINASVSSSVVTYSGQSVLGSAVSSISIPVAEYSGSTDTLVFYVGGIYQTPTTDYTLNSVAKTITKASGTWSIGDVLDFLVYKNVESTPTGTFDGALINAGTVSRTALSPAVQAELNSFLTSVPPVPVGASIYTYKNIGGSL